MNTKLYEFEAIIQKVHGLPQSPNEVDFVGKRSDTETSELFGGVFSAENEQSEVVATNGAYIAVPFDIREEFGKG